MSGGDYQLYRQDEAAAGRKPLGLSAWQKREHKRKNPPVNIESDRSALHRYADALERNPYTVGWELKDFVGDARNWADELVPGEDDVAGPLEPYVIEKREAPSTGYDATCRACEKISKAWDYRENAVLAARSHIEAVHPLLVHWEPLTSTIRGSWE